MRPLVSFLIGSGFSIPEGIPDVHRLNTRMSKIHESEILIHTNMTAIFLDGYDDPNRFSHRDERFFFQEFLEFYNADVLKLGETFHYETFYDFYSGYLRFGENKELIESFYQRFNHGYYKEGGDGAMDCINRVASFNRTFNQLLASQLHKKRYFEDVSYSNYPPYDAFFGFIRELIKVFDVKIHSLNHDLFLDWYGNHGPLWQFFSDGYELEGSPFYGDVSFDFKSEDDDRVHKTYKVKLARFTDKFDKPICFYKLHGGIFNVAVYTPDEEWVRVRDNYAVSRYYMEIFDENIQRFRFEHVWDDVSPDFLSGTTEKTRHYTDDPYYIKLFNYFENNLAASDLLVVIGYGFLDPGINEYLEKFYLSTGKKMLVIDPSNLQAEILKKYSHIWIKGRIEEVSFEEYMNHFPSVKTGNTF